MLPLVTEAFKTIPSDRPILQFLVRYYCWSFRDCCAYS
jgi:hypothetical protein